MNTYSIYALDTGLFTGVTIACPHDGLDANVPVGHSCMLGEYDRLCQRVDPATHQVIDYQPLQPSPQHEWREDVKRWVYVPTDEEVAQDVRAGRDQRLAETDWMVTRAAETGEPVPANWKAYRQALRDLTKQRGFPRNIEWPEKPQ